MAEDSRNNRPGDGRGNRKRRYFRRKPGERPAPDAAQDSAARSERPAREERPARSERTQRPNAAHGALPSREPSGERGARGAARRRRKSKGRRGGDFARVDQPAAPIERDNDYVPPTAVYIYTHVVRPGAGGAYEFRAEHFSKVGRTLEDYNIDVSPLFDEEARARARPSMAEIFKDFDMGEEEDAPAAPEPAEPEPAEPEPAEPEPAEHMDANLLHVGDDTGLPTYNADPYGAEDTEAPDEAASDASAAPDAFA